ncbi:PREDICTED: F-box/kelch-repeat protein At4g29370-like [Camelina sativa]|uniref:F-box/kelch-repeat protein At4g29370-like n=1 Tax=Camelina sativa TaxID=90675 RepID=A0ABM0UXQ1_CAMSA|nr:PREDICTED: F-box/kelch-repeat protein At4g29370-like [Camelina sativa]
MTLSSLPNELIVNCLARISISHYPSLSLVSKTFRSLISSEDLYAARSQLGTTEIWGLYIYLRFPTVPSEEPTPRWFRLRAIKPNQNEIFYGGRTVYRFVPSYIFLPHSNPTLTLSIAWKIYGEYMAENFGPSSAIWVLDSRSRTWGHVPNMKMKRKHASSCVFDDKIYVMGGCDPSCGDINWFEMYDIKTKTWRTLPENPDIKVRQGDNVVRKIDVVEGKIYVKTEAGVKDWVYNVKEGKWSVAEEQLSLLWSKSWCVIDNVMYCYSCARYKWYDFEAREWRDVKGLESLKKHRTASTDFRNCMVELVNCGGKLVILWDRFQRPGRSHNKNIWCAMVALEKGFGGAVWGKIEWVNVVLTVPKSYNFLRCIALSV